MFDQGDIEAALRSLDCTRTGDFARADHDHIVFHHRPATVPHRPTSRRS
jgi:hypothetical protein